MKHKQPKITLSSKELDRFKTATKQFNVSRGAAGRRLKNYIPQLQNIKNPLSHDFAQFPSRASYNLTRFDSKKEFYKELHRVEKGFRNAENVKLDKFKSNYKIALNMAVEMGNRTQASINAEMKKVNKLLPNELRAGLSTGQVNSVSQAFYAAHYNNVTDAEIEAEQETGE